MPDVSLGPLCSAEPSVFYSNLPQRHGKGTKLQQVFCVLENVIIQYEKVCADAKRPFLISLSNCIAITVLH